jgi:hypothetical protein
MKLATLILIAVVAMSSTSYACNRAGNSLFKSTAATTSNVAATQSSVNVAYNKTTKAVR